MQRIISRLIDFNLALCGLVVLTPVLAGIAVLIRVRMGSPVLFTQLRPGTNERLFTLYKFRTMDNRVDQSGQYLSDSERITKLGRVLRRTSLDELPQLFNVLKGDMAIVGPRPLLVEYVPYYSDQERVRHSVRPGITGPAQIAGRNQLPCNQRLALDAEYVRNWSLSLDLKIIWRTVVVVITGCGVSEAPELMTEEFEKRKACYSRGEPSRG